MLQFLSPYLSYGVNTEVNRKMLFGRKCKNQTYLHGFGDLVPLRGLSITYKYLVGNIGNDPIYQILQTCANPSQLITRIWSGITRYTLALNSQVYLDTRFITPSWFPHNHPFECQYSFYFTNVNTGGYFTFPKSSINKIG